MLALLIGTLLSTQNASCDEVRHVRGMAVAQGLDDHTLRTLEHQACAAPTSPPHRDDTANPNATSRACLDLSTMVVLGRAGGAAGIDEVDAMRKVACTIGLDDERLNWKSGTTARYATGAWNWPSGTTAKYATGAWNWPSGTTAKYATGAWNWPSGTTARYANGRFNDPSGASTSKQQLLAPVCARWPKRCEELVRLDAVDPDVAMASFLVDVLGAQGAAR